MIKILLIWLAALTLIADLSSDQATLDRPQVFCGRALAEARMLYCFATDDSVNSDGSEKTSTRNLEDFKMWWLTRQLAYMADGRGKYTGLVDECCLKPCFRSELLNYC